MHKRFSNVSVALLVAAVVCACSSSHNAKAPATLPGGTAQLTINDGTSRQTDTVNCLPMGWLTRVTTGETAASITALLSSENALSAKSVNINDVDGFTGSYMEGLQGEAYVSMNGRTYTIRGTAEGFSRDKPDVRTTGKFVIEIAC
ncbi:lipoprotein LpqH [Mycobacterium sp. pR1184]|uniref:lipoprotein LpqH n=1 Tax=Mycobacterium sp. pR1184 TaxID=3238981 RepID=UPI00351B4214